MDPLRIILLGGGFAGVFAARHLRKHQPQAHIELINKTNYFIFQPLLPEVAGGTIVARDAVTPLRSLFKKIRFRMAQINSIDTEKKCVYLTESNQHRWTKVSYDHLVIACGMQTNLSLMPGIVEHGFTMKTLADAYRLRNHIIECLEYADTCDDPQQRQSLLTFVVVGGGFSGVETAGEILEMIHKTLKYYPTIRKQDIRMVLIHREKILLPELAKSLGHYAQAKLEKRGTQVMLGSIVTSATINAVYLQDGTQILTRTPILTIGIEAAALVKTLPINLKRGRIVVDPYFRVEGLDNVWALGDAASVPMGDREEDGFAPPTAQFAVREAACLAKNLSATIDNRALEKFHYRPRGMMASIGNHSAIAEIFGFRLSGFFAWVMWRGFYLMMMPSVITRVRIGIDWFLDYFLPRSIVQIHNNPKRATHFNYYAAGDIIFSPGEINDGFYMVVSGKLESFTVDPKTSEKYHRILGPGEHWGERTAATTKRTVAYLKAVEDSRVLVLDKDDFINLRSSFHSLDDYFNQLDETLYPQALRKDIPPE